MERCKKCGFPHNPKDSCRYRDICSYCGEELGPDHHCEEDREEEREEE